MRYSVLAIMVLLLSCINRAPTPEIKNVEVQMTASPHGAHPMVAPSSQDVAPPALGSIPKAASGTIADIFNKRMTLKGSVVTVTGKVMKFSPNIMKTNWIHLQDGTSVGKATDITVTSTEIVKVGDLVTFRGKLSVDKDIGSGYFYQMLLEGSQIVH